MRARKRAGICRAAPARNRRADHSRRHDVARETAVAAEAANKVGAFLLRGITQVALQGKRVIDRAGQGEVAANGLVASEHIGRVLLRE